MEELQTIQENNQAEAINQKESTLLEWEANEFQSYERNWKWYLAILLVSLGVIGYSVYTRDWFIIGIVVVVNVFIFVYSKKQPKSVKYRVTQLGIYTDDHFYPFGSIHSFWLSLRDNEKKLNIIFMKKYLPQLSIILTEVDPLQIKTTLGKYIPEQENRSETLIDFMLRLLKLQ